MIIYRLTEGKYAKSMDGNGAKLYGGRWNSAGIPMLYTTGFISLAVLEVIIRISLEEIPSGFMLLKIEVPDSMEIKTIENKNLKKQWKEDIEYSRFMGDSFLKENKSAVLKVPSAVIDEEDNYLINTLHPDFKHIKLKDAEPFDFDKRLFLRNE